MDFIANSVNFKQISIGSGSVIGFFCTSDSVL